MVRSRAGRLLLSAAIGIAVSLGGVGRVSAQVSDAQATDGSTPLHDAIRAGDVAAVTALVTRGADVNASTAHGITPLVLAALMGQTPILRTLLDAGANPNAATPGGETPLMTA